MSTFRIAEHEIFPDHVTIICKSIRRLTTLTVMRRMALTERDGSEANQKSLHRSKNLP